MPYDPREPKQDRRPQDRPPQEPFLVDQWRCLACQIVGELYPPQDLNARRGEEGIEDILRDHRKRQPKGSWCNGFIQAVSGPSRESSARGPSGTF